MSDAELEAKLIAQANAVKHDFIPRSTTYPTGCVQCGRPRLDPRHTDVVRRDGVPSELLPTEESS